jgi:2-polyprenyl-6-methoxyphenol hydroxylase-like FAD-dependent oxidoreductase
MEAVKNKPLDVLIAGAGPAGLMMACQLALHKIRFRIIDKRTSPPKYSGALIIHARTMEIFHQMGLAEKAIKNGIIAHVINLRFNHKKNYSLDISSFGKTLTRYPYLLMAEQWQTELMLKQFLNEHGHWVEEGLTLSGFDQQEDLVTSSVTKPDGTVETINSRFLIGADGKDSLVRNHLKIPFPGKTQRSRLFITDCGARLPLSDREIFFSFAPDITSGFFPLKGGRWRVDGLIPNLQHNEVSFEEVGNFFSRKIHSGIALYHPDWFSVFRSHSRCASSFRLKQCFLIGDAAHVHSPVGAQGMNTGIQDAYNLAWKLAFYIRGMAGEKLLDSYQQERRPIAVNTIRYTDKAYFFLTDNAPFTRFLRLQLLSRCMPMILSWLNKKTELKDHIFVSISGIGISYKNSFLSSSIPGDNFPAHSPGPGKRWPYLTYYIKGRRYSLHNGLNSTHFQLFIFGRHILPQMFQSVLVKYNNILSLKYIDMDPDKQTLYDQLGLGQNGCYLVRPDMYICWRSHDFNGEELNDYLETVLK